MTTTDVQRLHLFELARRTWDEQAAETLMAALPPDSEELATKADIALVRSDMASEVALLRAETALLGETLRKEMAHQTRVLLVTLVPIILSAIGLAFAAAHAT